MHKKIIIASIAVLILFLGNLGHCIACGNERDDCYSFYGYGYPAYGGNYGYGGYYYPGYYNWDSSSPFNPYTYNRGREIERNLRQAPYNPPYFYDRQREIQRNIRQAPFYYYGADGFLSEQEALRYLRDYNVIF
ncbi:MAG TPA: hypothetical protein PLF30_03540 [Candidatus Moranbacteria bacterium]|jgi:hypothetical protein|nr:hypothetical protein [Candidatus Moranbacteria bacterium]HOF42498.1 hypothetical protein [Candidatus Moranbacteria bacterium]HPX94599.1 hypothetical protein [Candidatus Moranbacteria bacterium]HQB59802.1 hypothetical protein [Candidatus Moranbacteria bacterium]